MDSYCRQILYWLSHQGSPRSAGQEYRNKEDFCLITASLTPFTCLTEVNNVSTLSREEYMEMAENTVVNWWPICSCLSISTLFAKWLHRLPLRGGLYFSVSWIWARFVTCHSQHTEEAVFMPLSSLGLMLILSRWYENDLGLSCGQMKSFSPFLLSPQPTARPWPEMWVAPSLPSKVMLCETSQTWIRWWECRFISNKNKQTRDFTLPSLRRPITNFIYSHLNDSIVYLRWRPFFLFTIYFQ